MEVKNVVVEFKLFNNKGDKNPHKFIKTIQFFKHNNIDNELEEMCRSYEGHEKKTFICSYKILSVTGEVI